MKMVSLVKHFNMAKSTIYSILRNCKTIEGADVAKGVTVLTKLRSQKIEEMEKSLLT